jgi:large subunit ribosomal protein L29
MARTKKVEAPKEVVKRETEMDKIRKLDDATILENIEDLKKELFNLRFQAAVGKLENTDRISKAKKSIARMKTVLTERAKAVK